MTRGRLPLQLSHLEKEEATSQETEYSHMFFFKEPKDSEWIRWFP